MQFYLVVMLALAADYNELPPLWRTRLLLTQPAQNPDQNRRAYEASLQVDLSVEFKDYPLALKTLGQPEGTVALAWQKYQQTLKPGDTPPPFPERMKSAVARCEHEVVENAEDYLRVAFDAGPEQFVSATRSLRSPVEIGNALALLPNWDDPRAKSIGLDLAERLRRATSSRREFVAARELPAQVKRFASTLDEPLSQQVNEAFTYYVVRNEELPPCGAPAETVQQDFDELLRRIVRIDLNAGTEFEFTELVLRIYEISKGDNGRLEALENSGNVPLQLIVKSLRSAEARRRR